MLSATPTTGHRFVRWEGDVTNTNPSIEITMNRDMNVRAVFEKLQTHILTLENSVSTYFSGGLSKNYCPIYFFGLSEYGNLPSSCKITVNFLFYNSSGKLLYNVNNELSENIPNGFFPHLPLVLYPKVKFYFDETRHLDKIVAKIVSVSDPSVIVIGKNGADHILSAKYIRGVPGGITPLD